MTESKIKKVLLVCSGLLIVQVAGASELTVPNTFSAGTTAVASDVNDNFGAIEDAVNDNDGRIAALEGAGGSTFQASNAIGFGTGVLASGAGTLLRTANSVELRVMMAGLDTNAVYTLWWIIFNNPEECIAGTAPALCGEGDLDPNRDGEGVNPVDSGVRNAAAFITGMDGTGNVRGKLMAGPAPAGMVGFGQLNDSVGAEIHIVVQTHGAPLLGSVDQQMTIPGAGCNAECVDQFAVIFLPVPAEMP